VHIIDMASTEGRNPYEDYQTIKEELLAYDGDLGSKKQIIVANKMDMPDAEEHLKDFKEKLEENESVYPISTITKEDITALLYEIADELEKIPKLEVEEETVIIQPKVKKEAYVITREDDGAFVLKGNKIKQLLKITNLDLDERYQGLLRQRKQRG